MEELTRTQTVLLCVLVSFVTSIGTGIITVSLLQEVPTGVTQTINQVVERTVERVVPGPSSQTVREVTVVVKEEDLVIDSIKKNERSLVRIVSGSPSSVPTSGSVNALALGLVVSQSGNILVDRRAVSEGNSFTAIFHDGKRLPVKLVSSSQPNSANFAGNIPNSAYLEAVRAGEDANYVFHPAVVASSDSLQLGQTIITLGGRTQNQVSTGRVGLVNYSDSSAAATSTGATRSMAMIQTENSLKDEIPGSLLLNLNGELVGVEIWRPDAPSLPDQFTPFNMIRTAGAKFFQ